MQPSRFVAGLTPLPTAARVTRQRSLIRSRIITSLVSLALFGVMFVVFRATWGTGWIIAVLTLWLVSTAVGFSISAVGLRNAKRDLATIHEGDAFYLDPHGIEFVYPSVTSVAWADVTSFSLKGHKFGAGPALVVEAGGTEVASIPVSFLDATPAVIDSATQAYSLGRVRLDTEALDNVL